MPLDTIVDSWRVMIARSPSLMRLKYGISSRLRRAALLGDVEDDQALALELIGDGLLGLRVDLALGLLAEGIDRAEREGAHQTAKEPAPSRRRSSSGVEERASASCWVILPERTSVARAASIVCMPRLPPV